MSNVQNIVITIALICWFALIVFELIKKKRQYIILFGIQIFLMVAIGWSLNRFLGFFVFDAIETKGGDSVIREGWLLFWMFFFTVLGIVGHHLYAQVKDLNERGRPRKLKWMPLLKPLPISVIVFASTLAALNQIGAKTDTLTAVILQFCIAYQNGFFWKNILEKKQLEVK